MNDLSAVKRWGALFSMLVSLVLFGTMAATPALAAGVSTTNNNFTMLDAGGGFIGGTNTVAFTWDGTTKTSVVASGQVSNATIGSGCPFFGLTWQAHDVAIYGPGTYTVYDGCAAGSPGCGAGNAVTFTVGAGQLGGHMLFLWNSNDNIDVVDIWQTGAFGPSNLWTGACGSNSGSTVWDHMSTDWDGDGINGAPMTDGPFAGSNANFNLMGVPAAAVVPEPILWYNTGSGMVYAQTTDGATITGGALAWTEPDLNWSIVNKGDFNGDGVRDYAWRNSSNGQVYIMLMTSPTVVNSGAVVWAEPDAAWKIVASGDLNNDTRTDLIWWNSSTGQVYGMLMNGTSPPSGAMIWTEANTNWKIVAAADLNNDSMADLIWWNSATGQVYGMLMNGTTVSSSAMIWTEPDVSNWRIVGAGDVNGDSNADLIWRNRTTGQVYGMLMNGTSVSSPGLVWTEPDLNWEIVSIGKYNNDANADLLWRHKTSGMVYHMPMNGLTSSGGSVLWTEASSSWRIMGDTEWKNNAYGVGVVTP